MFGRASGIAKKKKKELRRQKVKGLVIPTYGTGDRLTTLLSISWLSQSNDCMTGGFSLSIIFEKKRFTSVTRNFLTILLNHSSLLNASPK